jgi:hypothetical protein
MWIRVNSGTNAGKAYNMDQFLRLEIGTNGTVWVVNGFTSTSMIALTGQYLSEDAAIHAMYALMIGSTPEVP